MSEFTDYLYETFALFGPIQARRMFGGHGIYHEGLMFGLVSDDALYLKADAENAVYFEQLGLSCFAYDKQGKTVHLSYYQAPDSVLEEREEAAIWARRSYEAALRGRRRRAA